MEDMVIGSGLVAGGQPMAGHAAVGEVLLFARMCLNATARAVDRSDALFDRMDRRPFSGLDNDGSPGSQSQVFAP